MFVCESPFSSRFTVDSLVFLQHIGWWMSWLTVNIKEVLITCLGNARPASILIILLKSFFLPCLCLYTQFMTSLSWHLEMLQMLISPTFSSWVATSVVLPILDSVGRCSPTLTRRLVCDLAVTGSLCCQVLPGCLFCPQHWRPPSCPSRFIFPICSNRATVSEIKHTKRTLKQVNETARVEKLFIHKGSIYQTKPTLVSYICRKNGHICFCVFCWSTAQNTGWFCDLLLLWRPPTA